MTPPTLEQMLEKAAAFEGWLYTQSIEGHYMDAGSNRENRRLLPLLDAYKKLAAAAEKVIQLRDDVINGRAAIFDYDDAVLLQKDALAELRALVGGEDGE